MTPQDTPEPLRKSDTPSHKSPPHGHLPVMSAEVLQQLDPQPGETIVDATAGRGGHAADIGRRIAPGGRLILFDLDAANLAYATDRVRAESGLEPIGIEGSFASVGRELKSRDIVADGLLADLGFSSNQLEQAERGFSFMRDGPLDMRLDSSTPLKAEDLLATLSEPDLADLIRRFGEDPSAKRIARKIVAQRAEEPIQTTAQLARLVREAYGPRAREARVHPATRTFQALRIAVNDELGALDALLDEVERTAKQLAKGSPGWLSLGARVVVIGFHSLEDRAVKQAFARMADQGMLQDRSRKPLKPTRTEIRSNPRARSAKLRCAKVGNLVQ
ncbi:MAG: 16S rRNA (cytosine(1402)-N(4))-methyltransferase RsmH [Phycisphaerales bacterium]|nr:16S rRNA (cytosine(1402)-N(4))-methyltransferase RsmH [Phycisphaerales bacterium]